MKEAARLLGVFLMFAACMTQPDLAFGKKAACGNTSCKSVPCDWGPAYVTQSDTGHNAVLKGEKVCIASDPFLLGGSSCTDNKCGSFSANIFHAGKNGIVYVYDAKSSDVDEYVKFLEGSHADASVLTSEFSKKFHQGALFVPYDQVPQFESAYAATHPSTACHA